MTAKILGLDGKPVEKATKGDTKIDTSKTQFAEDQMRQGVVNVIENGMKLMDMTSGDAEVTNLLTAKILLQEACRIAIIHQGMKGIKPDEKVIIEMAKICHKDVTKQLAELANQ